jgi:hypothetical protein
LLLHLQIPDSTGHPVKDMQGLRQLRLACPALPAQAQKSPQLFYFDPEDVDVFGVKRDYGPHQALFKLVEPQPYHLFRWLFHLMTLTL